ALVKVAVAYRWRVSRGACNVFRIHLSPNERIRRDLLATRSRLRALTIKSMTMNAKPVPVDHDGMTAFLWHTRIEAPDTVIACFFELYHALSDMQRIVPGRYVKESIVGIEESDELRYEYIPLGGLQAVPSHEGGGSVELPIPNWCHPDQGYLVRWFPGDALKRRMRGTEGLVGAGLY